MGVCLQRVPRKEAPANALAVQNPSLQFEPSASEELRNQNGTGSHSLSVAYSDLATVTNTVLFFFVLFFFFSFVRRVYSWPLGDNIPSIVL